MLNSPVLKVEVPPEPTLLTRRLYADDDDGSPRISDWWSLSHTWISNDEKPEIAKINSAAKGLLTEYATLLRPTIRNGLIAQTDVICDPDDWEEDDVLPSLDSYRCMLKGLIELAPVSRPNLSVSDNGNIIAGWFSDAARSVFEFLPQDRISWVISRKIGEVTNRAAGIEPLPKIRTISLAHDATFSVG